MQIPQELVEQIEKGNVVLFLGAGVSMSAGLPGDAELAQELADRAELGALGGRPLPEVAQAYELRRGYQSLVDYVTRRIDDPQIFPGPAHELIVTMPFDRIVTTYWDRLLEEALRRQRRAFDTVVRDSDISFTNEDNVLVVKLHGSIEQKDTLVITGDDYYDVFARLPQTANLVQVFFATKTILFLGFGLADEDFKRLYQEVVRHLGRHMRRAYAVQRGPDELTVRYWETKNVQIIDADLTDFLEALATQLGLSSSATDEQSERRPARFRRRRPFLRALIPRLSGEERRQLCEAVDAPEEISDEDLTAQIAQSLTISDRQKRHPLEMILQRLGRRAVGVLIRVLEDKSADRAARRRAADLLGAIADDEAQQALARAMDDEDEAIQAKAASALTRAQRGQASAFTFDKEYDTFELLIGFRGPDGYPVNVITATGGDARGTLALDPTATEVKGLLDRIEYEQTDEQLFIDLGGMLFTQLFPDQVEDVYRASLGQAQGQNRGLRLRLRIEPAELAALPWEFLYDERRDLFLGVSPDTPLNRYVPVAEPIRPLTVEPPLRVLAVLSNPVDLAEHGFDPLNTDEEEEVTRGALMEVMSAGLVELEVMRGAVASEIRRQIRSYRPHVFHFVGHGTFGDAGAALVLEDNDRRTRMVSDRTFREFFLGSDDTRLVLLNACQTATVSSARPLAGMAPQLVQRGLPAVVAMQYPVYGDAAVSFVREFYQALALGYPVDAATSEARRGIYIDYGAEMRDWAVPVVLMRAKDGVIFKPTV